MKKSFMFKWIIIMQDEAWMETEARIWVPITKL